MKQSKKRLLALAISVVLIISLIPIAHAATYDYPVEGGNLKFDPTTGTIKACDHSVYSADIPSEIYGVPVTAIGRSAFENHKKLTRLTIPSTVSTIGSYAFFYCSNLQYVEIPASVTEVGERAFEACTSLESVIVPGSIKEIPGGMFSGCAKLKTVILQEGIEKIDTIAFGSSAYSTCKSLEELVLPDSLKEVSWWAFGGCTSLKKITFGTGLKRLDDGALRGLNNLSELYFTGNAPSATSKIIDKFADGFKIYYPEGASGWTTPTWNGFITEAYTLPGTQPTTPSTPDVPVTPSTPETTKVTAVPTQSAVLVNGQPVAFEAYGINGNNYFKLRDLAFILSGSEVQFEVTWSKDLGAILMTSGKAYTPGGGEMSGKGTINQIGIKSTSNMYLDGQAVNLTAYAINDNNYFKLRDIGELFNFSVEWDSANQQILVDTSKPYSN